MLKCEKLNDSLRFPGSQRSNFRYSLIREHPYNVAVPASCKFVLDAPLSAFVKCFWYWEGAPQGHTKERLMPNGEPTIVFNLGDDAIRIYDADDLARSSSYGRAVVSGPRTGSFVIDSVQEERVFGIQFLPGGSYPFFRTPTSELENRSLALTDLWPRRAEEFREQLLEASSVREMFAVAEKLLLSQMVKPMELHRAVAFARREFCRSPHRVSVGSVLGQVGLSQRRFIELFTEQVGLAPKAFCRVRRCGRASRS